MWLRSIADDALPYLTRETRRADNWKAVSLRARHWRGSMPLPHLNNATTCFRRSCRAHSTKSAKSNDGGA